MGMNPRMLMCNKKAAVVGCCSIPYLELYQQFIKNKNISLYFFAPFLHNQSTKRKE